VPRLKDIECPMLGVCGDDDPCPDDPQLLSAARNFKQAWIAGARRFSMVEAPAAFNAALTQFLDALP
jgi:pimeloyl-ACP methyl ester carboxylesterase